MTVESMARRFIKLLDRVERLVRRCAKKERRAPSYVALGEGPEDLGRMAEHYLYEVITARGDHGR
jgi:hypothetical protein